MGDGLLPQRQVPQDGEVVGERGVHGDGLAVDLEGELEAVQGEAVHAVVPDGAVDPGVAVGAVAEDRVGQAPQVTADLVEATGVGLGHHQGAAGLGAGRKHKGDPVDPAVGIVFRSKVGDRVEVGQELGVVHARDEDGAAAAVAGVLGSLSWSDQPVEPLPLLLCWYG